VLIIETAGEVLPVIVEIIWGRVWGRVLPIAVDGVRCRRNGRIRRRIRLHRIPSTPILERFVVVPLLG